MLGDTLLGYLKQTLLSRRAAEIFYLKDGEHSGPGTLGKWRALPALKTRSLVSSQQERAEEPRPSDEGAKADRAARYSLDRYGWSCPTVLKATMDQCLSAVATRHIWAVPSTLLQFLLDE